MKRIFGKLNASANAGKFRNGGLEEMRKTATFHNSEQQHLLKESVNKWLKNPRKEEKSDGFQNLADTWGTVEVICALAESRWNYSDTLAEELRGVTYFDHVKRPIGKKLTIAAHYPRIQNGGAQRVVAQLCNLWSKMKDANGESLLRVVLITEGDPQEDEYPLDDGVERTFLPPAKKSRKKNFRARAEAWERILSEFSIDIVIHSNRISESCFWDMLCVKGHKTKPAFLIHAHGFCGEVFSLPGDAAFTLAMQYRLCDGVIVLSECDKRYTSAFCSNVKYIPNMLTFSVKDTPITSREKNTLLWCARIASTKQPLDVVRMMEYVVREVPDAKLYIVGGDSNNLSVSLKKLVKSLHLENNIVFTGFTTDVAHYYRKASVFIGTSSCEGFWLTLGEAMTYGVPIVSYDLPWLTFMRDGRGIVTVEQKRYDLLAKEVISLLRDPERAKKIGEAGRAQAEDREAVDIGAEWKDMFDRIGEATSTLDPEEKILYEYLCRFQQTGRNVLAIGLGRAGASMLLQVMRGIRSCREYGFVCTIKRFFSYIAH